MADPNQRSSPRSENDDCMFRITCRRWHFNNDQGLALFRRAFLSAANIFEVFWIDLFSCSRAQVSNQRSFLCLFFFHRRLLILQSAAI